MFPPKPYVLSSPAARTSPTQMMPIRPALLMWSTSLAALKNQEGGGVSVSGPGRESAASAVAARKGRKKVHPVNLAHEL